MCTTGVLLTHYGCQIPYIFRKRTQARISGYRCLTKSITKNTMIQANYKCSYGKIMKSIKTGLYLLKNNIIFQKLIRNCRYYISFDSFSVRYVYLGEVKSWEARINCAPLYLEDWFLSLLLGDIVGDVCQSLHTHPKRHRFSLND